MLKISKHSVQTTPALYHTGKKLLEYITRLFVSSTVNGSCVSKWDISPSSRILRSKDPHWSNSLWMDGSSLPSLNRRYFWRLSTDCFTLSDFASAMITVVPLNVIQSKRKWIFGYMGRIFYAHLNLHVFWGTEKIRVF